MDLNALSVCTSMSWASNKNTCMKMITNKVYDSRATDLCMDLTWDDEQIECMKGAYSEPYNPLDPRVELIEKAAESLLDLILGK